MSESRPEQTEPVAPPPVADIKGLLVEASILPAALEKKWSEGLQDGVLDETGELKAKWSALALELSREVHRREESFKLAGQQVKFPTFPVGADFFELTDSDGHHSLQLLGAQLYTMKALLRSLDTLSRPSVRSINVVSGEVDSWWSSGAFFLVRNLAEAAVRLQARTAPRDSESIGDTSGADAGHPLSSPWQETAGLARRALDIGLAEGALVYCAMSLNGLGEHLHASGDLGSPDPLRMLRSNPQSAHLAVPAEQLLAAAVSLTNGSTEPAKICILANFWVDQLTWDLYRILRSGDAPPDFFETLQHGSD